jgi:hypothetical protein
MYHNSDKEALELYLQYLRWGRFRRNRKDPCIGCPKRRRRIAV